MSEKLILEQMTCVTCKAPWLGSNWGVDECNWCRGEVRDGQRIEGMGDYAEAPEEVDAVEGVGDEKETQED